MQLLNQCTFLWCFKCIRIVVPKVVDCNPPQVGNSSLIGVVQEWVPNSTTVIAALQRAPAATYRVPNSFGRHWEPLYWSTCGYQYWTSQPAFSISGMLSTTVVLLKREQNTKLVQEREFLWIAPLPLAFRASHCCTAFEMKRWIEIYLRLPLLFVFCFYFIFYFLKII